MNIAVKKTSDNDETMPKADVQLAWDAPVRPYKKRDKSFFQTIAAIFLLLTVILFFIREWLIIGVALAVVFVVYVLATVPPGIVTYKITDKGVWVGDLFFRYLHLTEYWFDAQLGNTVLVLIAPMRTASRISIVIFPKDKEKIDAALRKHLVFREKPIKSFIDSAAEWMSKAIPLEEKHTLLPHNLQVIFSDFD